MTQAGRRFLAVVATALAAVAILAALLASYADHSLADSAGFAGRAVAVVRTPAVESAVVGIVTDQIVARAGNAGSVEPVIKDAVSLALSNELVTRQIRAAATSLQSQLTSGTASRLTLRLPDIGPSIASVIESRSPPLADEVRNLGAVTVLDVAIPRAEATLINDLARTARDSLLLVVLSVALVVLALLLSPSRARTLRALGISAVVSGLLVAAIYVVGRGIVVDKFSAGDARAAAGAVWSSYLGGLETWGLVLAGSGALVAALAALAASRVRSRRYQAR